MKKHKSSWMRLKALNTLFLLRCLSCGVCSNEIYNAQIDGKFIVINALRPNKRIPIIRALASYLDNTDFLNIPGKYYLELRITEILSDF